MKKKNNHVWALVNIYGESKNNWRIKQKQCKQNRMKIMKNGQHCKWSERNEEEEKQKLKKIVEHTVAI